MTSPDRVRPRVVLIGPPGAGKTSVARQIAAWWQVAARDTDADIEASTGEAIADIFVNRGEPAFRELEVAAVIAALNEHPGVLALGGGAVMNPAVEQALQGHTVVFLEVGLADAANRVGLNQARPLLLGNPRARWQELMNARRPVYQRCATSVVSTDGRTVAEVASAVIAAVDHAQEAQPQEAQAADQVGTPQAGEAR